MKSMRLKHEPSSGPLNIFCKVGVLRLRTVPQVARECYEAFVIYNFFSLLARFSGMSTPLPPSHVSTHIHFFLRILVYLVIYDYVVSTHEPVPAPITCVSTLHIHHFSLVTTKITAQLDLTSNRKELVQ